MARHIFFSYSFIRRAVAEALATAIETAGLKCWLTTRDSAPSSAISESQGLLLLICSNSAVSSHVYQEVKLAASQGKKIVSVIIEKTVLSKKMNNLLARSVLYDASSSPIDEHIDKIKEIVVNTFKYDEGEMLQHIDPSVLQQTNEDQGVMHASSKVDDGEEYDVFISCKSEDNKFAKIVYNFLLSKGLGVFFSKETLPRIGSADYREQIENAIDKSRNMVVVASKGSHANAKWVKFEWGLFLNEKLAERKDGNLLTVLADGLAVAKLPIALRGCEAIPLAQGELERLFEYVRPNLSQNPSDVDVNQSH